jgi:hypothetical protein
MAINSGRKGKKIPNPPKVHLAIACRGETLPKLNRPHFLATLEKLGISDIGKTSLEVGKGLGFGIADIGSITGGPKENTLILVLDIFDKNQHQLRRFLAPLAPDKDGSSHSSWRDFLTGMKKTGLISIIGTSPDETVEALDFVLRDEDLKGISTLLGNDTEKNFNLNTDVQRFEATVRKIAENPAFLRNLSDYLQIGN